MNSLSIFNPGPAPGSSAASTEIERRFLGRGRGFLRGLVLEHRFLDPGFLAVEDSLRDLVGKQLDRPDSVVVARNGIRQTVGIAIFRASSRAFVSREESMMNIAPGMPFKFLMPPKFLLSLR